MLETLNKNTETIAKTLTVLFVVAYGIGFLTWNIYLNQFGYFESNFLQTRFLSTGLACIFLSVLVVPLLMGIYKQVSKWNWPHWIRETLLISLSVLWIIIFSLFILPIFPQSVGGAQPFVKSIIAESETISFLSNFNFSMVENGAKFMPSVQTELICEIYSSETMMIVGVIEKNNTDKGRILILDKTLFKGYQVVRSEASKARNAVCGPFFYTLI